MSRAALAHLRRVDPVLGALIPLCARWVLDEAAAQHPFQALAHAIAHQQLNGLAANTILRRFCEACGQGAFPTPHSVLAVEIAVLRAAGFSAAKIAALRDLATHTLSGMVPDRVALDALSDAEIIARLTRVRGIGRWTVEMLLIFQLGRPDVLPVDDFGVRNGFRLAYGLRKLPHPKALAAYGARWAPYRSTATWYLWRAVELARAGTLPAPKLRIRLPAVRRRRAPLKKAQSARARR